MIFKINRTRLPGSTIQGPEVKPPPKTDGKKMNNSHINILYPYQRQNNDVFINK